MMLGSIQCDLCRAKFPASEFSGGGAIVLLGRKICHLCVEKTTLYCHFCRAGITENDFEEGRAVTLLGKRYCEKCLAAAVERSKPSGANGSSVGRPIQVEATPSPSTRILPISPLSPAATGAELRAFARFVPPREARLQIRPAGLNGVFGGNRVRMWLDLSEGGVRAIVEGDFENDDELQAELRYPPEGAKVSVLLKVRHAHASKSFPGCSVVGLKFVEPDHELRHLVRTHLRKHPLLAEMEGEPSDPPPPPEALPVAAQRPPTPKAG